MKKKVQENMRNVFVRIKNGSSRRSLTEEGDSKVSEGLWMPDRCVSMTVTIHNGKSLLI